MSKDETNQNQMIDSVLARSIQKDKDEKSFKFKGIVIFPSSSVIVNGCSYQQICIWI